MVLRVCALLPTVLAGSLIAVMGLGFLPTAGLVGAILADVTLWLILVCGGAEPLAARLFGLAHGPRPSERVLLEPALMVAAKVGLAPTRVLVGVSDARGLPARPIGRGTVIVDPRLLKGLSQRSLSAIEVAAALGHAVASQRVGPARFDLAARFLSFPWTVLRSAIGGVMRALSWEPSAEWGWFLRILGGVVAVVALVGGLQPGGDEVVGAVTAVLVALSYLRPVADRAWRSAVASEAQRVVARRGLGGALARVVAWSDGAPADQRLRTAPEAAGRTPEATAWPDARGRSMRACFGADLATAVPVSARRLPEAAAATCARVRGSCTAPGLGRGRPREAGYPPPRGRARAMGDRSVRQGGRQGCNRGEPR